MLSYLFQIALFVLPWGLRRRVLCSCYSYRIDPSARIGYSVISAQNVLMGPGSRIRHLTIVKGVELLELGEQASIGNLNWITGSPLENNRHYAVEKARDPSLIVKANAAITNRHYIDCTDRVTVGAFSTVAGWYSQILTHAIDLRECRQSCGPVIIGSYCFVGTGAILLKGAVLPDRSVLGAGSVLARPMTATGRVYVGNPAADVRPIDEDAKYFNRTQGFVD